jgi:hypothetical protein
MFGRRKEKKLDQAIESALLKTGDLKSIISLVTEHVEILMEFLKEFSPENSEEAIYVNTRKEIHQALDFIELLKQHQAIEIELNKTALLANPAGTAKTLQHLTEQYNLLLDAIPKDNTALRKSIEPLRFRAQHQQMDIERILQQRQTTARIVAGKQIPGTTVATSHSAAVTPRPAVAARPSQSTFIGAGGSGRARATARQSPLETFKASYNAAKNAIIAYSKNDRAQLKQTAEIAATKAGIDARQLQGGESARLQKLARKLGEMIRLISDNHKRGGSPEKMREGISNILEADSFEVSLGGMPAVPKGTPQRAAPAAAAPQRVAIQEVAPQNRMGPRAK